MDEKPLARRTAPAEAIVKQAQRQHPQIA